MGKSLSLSSLPFSLSLSFSLSLLEKERERERKWTEWRVRSFTFAFGSVDILLQVLNYEQTTISEAQIKAKTLFFVYRP
jgi:hypothetical protein